MVRHGKYFTTYTNLSTVSVTKGEKVQTGQIVGQVDSKGQLDFVVSDEKGINYDPERWLGVGGEGSDGRYGVQRLGSQEMVIERFVLRDDAVDIEVFRVGQRVGLEAFEGGFITEDMDRVFAHSMDVADVIEVTGFALNGDFGEAAGIGGDDRDARGHGFEGGEAKALIFRGQQEEVGYGENFFHLFLFADEPHVIADIEFAAEAFGVGTFRAIPDE